MQAKQYGDCNTVQRPQLQAFVGALECFDRIQSRVALIDRARLAELKIRYCVGVQLPDTFFIVEIDEDYFEQGFSELSFLAKAG